MTGPRPIPHAARRQRRRAMASKVKKGVPIAEVAADFEVSTRTVQNACRENGVSPPPHGGHTPNYKVIADLCGRSVPLRVVAAAHGCSVQAVSHILAKCVAAGIPVKPRPGRWGKRTGVPR